MMAYVGEFILSGKGVFLACSIIILSAFWAIIRFSHRIFPIINVLKEANQKIAEYEDERQFSENYEEFNGWVKNTPLLKFPWEEFTETLILEPDQKIKNTDDAVTYFNESSIISPTVNIRFYNSVPNIITGAGILGTFIGLVFGVEDAARNIAGQANAHLPPEVAMKALLHGASLAFTTSISGLFMSMVFSWYEKHFLNKAHGYIRSWNLSLDERLERLTPERLAVDTYREVQQQTQELKAFNTDLIWSITQSLEDNIGGKLQPILTDLLGVTRQMRDNRDATNEEMLKGVVDEFKEAIQGAAGKEMAQLGETLGDLNDKLFLQTSGMTEAHEKMAAGTKDLLEQVGDVIKSSVDGLKETLINVDSAATAMGKTATQFMEITKQLIGSFEQFETISRRLENVSLTLEETGEALKESNRAQTEAVVSIKESIDNLYDTHNQVAKSWESYSNRFGDIDESLSKFFTDLQQGVQAYSEQVNSFLQDIDRLMADSIDKLGGATSEIRDTVEGLSEQLDDIAKVFANAKAEEPVYNHE
ncbi:hypothetical protein SAMN05660420_02864 [Desulfuromusa kysingii]|uniref:Uncharacterized protein n=1 Tax=Desulfuromusa kysingii TaxID=37625 RepID=A0A1H4D6W3_9BACT|nr:hypothetical protein [Desulfuromusa kysingii]SEA68357.1 hypothetical protein SAMN05660420_02864 [Desulfuromusa kysingii]